MKNKHINETSLLKGQLARALADYDNLQKRTEAVQSEIVKLASLKLVLKLLSILDMLYEAQKHLNDSGLAITIKEFEDIIAGEGIVKINTKINDKFNEEENEAIEIRKGNSDNKGKIESVVLTGWKYQVGPVVRHAKVRVYSD